MLLLATGCAGWKPHAASKPTVSENRSLRHSAVVRDFEQQRDAMQLQAAIDRFNQGDLAGCESRLVKLVERRPDFAEARLRLAEVAWSRGDAAAAEQHYQAVLSARSDSAEAHHGLGMLLTAVGRFGEANPHLRRAIELDPQNEAYRLAEGP